ncbi:MAG TPA: hypothetical protein VH855_04205 [Acetobacteraceae bacterium]|jgi:hypothetical protein
MSASNLDESTVRSFGREWFTHNQPRLLNTEGVRRELEEYFDIFPWHDLRRRRMSVVVAARLDVYPSLLHYWRPGAQR